MKLKALIAISLAGLSVLAAAQADKPLGISARVGAFLPSNSTARDAGTSWLDFGIDYTLHEFEPKAAFASRLSLSIDYSVRQDFRQIPILINYVYRQSELYYFAGIGGNFTRIPVVGGSQDTTHFAYDLGVGYDLLKN